MNVAFDGEEETDEAILLARYARGDQSAARALTRALLPRVLVQARHLLGDAALAEDIAQEAMLRLWRVAPDWRAGEARVSTWLYRVVANLCTDHLRKRRGVGLDDVPEQADGAPTVEAALAANDRSAALLSALQELPARQRQAVSLRHLEELPNPEVAEIMGVSVEAVESLTARGRQKLKDRLITRQSALGLDR